MEDKMMMPKNKMKKMMSGKDMMTEKDIKKMMSGMEDEMGFYGHHTVKSYLKKK